MDNARTNGTYEQGETKMKKFGLIIAFFAASTAFGQSPTPSPKPEPTAGLTSTGYVRPDAKTRQKRYVNSLVGPVALTRIVATAGYSTWRNSPDEWGTKWEGFGRRVGSNFGKNVIKQSVTFGLDEALKLDSHYYRSTKKDFGSKVRNALISPFTARDRNGKRVPGVPRIAGTFASSIIANTTWYPKNCDWKDGVQSGAISFGFTALFNLIKEFAPKK